MTFRTIIKAIREDVLAFPTASDIPIVLYDRKDRVIDGEDVIFVEDLFVKNPRNKEKFLNFLNYLEKNPVSSMNVRVDEHSVVVFYKSADVTCFSRRPPLDPLDYMD